MKNALDQPFCYQLDVNNQRIMDVMIKKAFIKPNSKLKWTDEPYPWTLYIPPISPEDLTSWNKN